MAPVAAPGDWLLVDPTVRTWPPTGRLVVIEEPDTAVLSLKRVAAGPGARVPFENGYLVLAEDEAWLLADASPEETAAAEMKRIAAMSGAEFDRAFVGHMVKDHEKDVALFRAQAKDGKDEELKGLAAATLPTLEEHLKMAQALAGQGKASN